MQKIFILVCLVCLSTCIMAQHPSKDTIITITGTGAMDTNKPYAVAKLMARRAAIVDAQRQALEYAMGTKLDSNTKVQDFVTEYDQVQSQVEGWVNGVQIVATRYNNDGTVEVDASFNASEFARFMARYQFFNVVVWPGVNIFVIDASGSMTEAGYDRNFRSRWNMALHELKRCIHSLQVNDQHVSNQNLGLVFFSDGIKKTFTMTGVSVQTQKQACTLADEVVPSGATNYYIALHTAAGWLKHAPQNTRKAIYLLGDGEPNRGPSPYWDHIYKLAQSMQGVKIHVIYCGSSEPQTEAHMKKLAEMTGGTFKKN